MPLFVKIILYVVIVAVVSVGAGYAAWACATDVLAFGRSSDTIQVTVPENASLDAITDMLHENGLIQYPWLFKLYCKFTHSAGRMDAGTYEQAYNYDYHALVSGMTESGGTRTTVRVMLPEGATCAQIFALLEKNEVCTAEKLGESAANTHFDYWFLKDIPYGETNRLEGFLFPDTYEFYQGMQASSAINKFLENFHNRITAEMLEKADERGMSMQEVVTVASMIEKEAANDDERAMIAAVIYNRIAAGMPLQIDSTIMYVLPEHKDVLTVEDTKIDSPYNTYQNTGLPPTPIANPGLASIKATLSPASTKALYYALDSESGTHKFFTSYGEFQAFVAKQSYSQ